MVIGLYLPFQAFKSVMTILDQFHASGGGKDVAILTLELTCPAWTEPVLICNGFEDQVRVTDGARAA